MCHAAPEAAHCTQSLLTLCAQRRPFPATTPDVERLSLVTDQAGKNVLHQNKQKNVKSRPSLMCRQESAPLCAFIGSTPPSSAQCCVGTVVSQLKQLPF